jgi:hypothetical protein
MALASSLLKPASRVFAFGQALFHRLTVLQDDR